MKKDISSRVVIVTPTYNEKENIGRLIKYLFDTVEPNLSSQYQLTLLVVDDSSPDGTSKVVTQLQKTYPQVELYRNKKKLGLGSAYMKGMKYAVEQLQADLLFEMDADLSHDPDVIPDFLTKISQGDDLVLGSRYISGGSIPDNWGVHRKLLSAVGNLTIRIAFWNWKIHDWTTGYRCMTAQVFTTLLPQMQKKRFSGYTFQIGFLHQAIEHDFTIGEVPINFVDREYGQSKLGVEYIKNTLVYIISIRAQQYKRFIKFAIVGSIGFIVNYTSMEVFYRGIGLAPDNAAALGAELAIISNFTLNNAWTFKDRKAADIKAILYKFFQFNMFSLGAVAIQKGVVSLGVDMYGEQHYRLYFIIAVGLGLMVNFVIYNKIIWRHPR